MKEGAPKPSPFAIGLSSEHDEQPADQAEVVQQQQQQVIDSEIEQVEDTLPQEPLAPQLEVRDSDPAEEPHTPELVAGSFTEGHCELLKPTAEDCSSNSVSRCNRGRQAGRAVVKAAAAVIKFMQPRRKTKA